MGLFFKSPAATSGGWVGGVGVEVLMGVPSKSYPQILAWDVWVIKL